jgi:hypothetical protein
LISVCVNYCENTEKEVYFAGWAGKDDMESLQEIAKDKGKIMFPGVLSGWDSEEKALKSIEGFSGEGKQAVSKVVYKIKTKVHSAVVCREFVTRLRATIQNLEEKDGVTHIELAEQNFEFGTVAEWIQKRDNPPKEEKAEEKAAEAGEKKEEAPAEGEAMGGEAAME